MAKLASSQSRLYTDHIAQLYPYHVWFDGQAWELEQGVDYHCHTRRMRSHLYNVADSFGHRLRTRATPGGLIVQAIDKVTGKPLTP